MDLENSIPGVLGFRINGIYSRDQSLSIYLALKRVNNKTITQKRETKYIKKEEQED